MGSILVGCTIMAPLSSCTQEAHNRCNLWAYFAPSAHDMAEILTASQSARAGQGLTVRPATFSTGDCSAVDLGLLQCHPGLRGWPRSRETGSRCGVVFYLANSTKWAESFVHCLLSRHYHHGVLFRCLAALAPHNRSRPSLLMALRRIGGGSIHVRHGCSTIRRHPCPAMKALSRKALIPHRSVYQHHHCCTHLTLQPATATGSRTRASTPTLRPPPMRRRAASPSAFAISAGPARTVPFQHR